VNFFFPAHVKVNETNYETPVCVIFSTFFLLIHPYVQLSLRIHSTQTLSMKRVYKIPLGRFFNKITNFTTYEKIPSFAKKTGFLRCTRDSSIGYEEKRVGSFLPLS
jgi:hypothetical protein